MKEKWSIEQINAWYAAQPWPVGCNYVPSDAVNSVEMWRKDTFNPTLIKKIGLSSLRLYANVNNAFLITSKDYNGYDPDNSSRLGDNKWGANRQFFTYPRPRTFTFGLNVAF